MGRTYSETAEQSAANGRVILNSQTFNTAAFVASTNGVYAIPSAGTWTLRYDIFTDGSGVTPTGSMFAITDSVGVVVPGTERSRGGSSTAGQCISAQAIVTTTDAANYFLRGRSVPSGSVTVLKGAVGQSTIDWQQIGTVALTGFFGANGVAPGAGGTVPAPAALDNHKFLKGNATFGDAIGKISTTTGISALTAGVVTPLYTVPAGRTLNTTHIAIKTNTVAGTVTTNPSLSIGSNASTYDNLMATTAMIGVVAA